MGNNNTMLNGEEIIYHARLSFSIFIIPLITLVVLMIFAAMSDLIILILCIFFLLILVFLSIILVYFTTSYILTNRRIIAKRGIFNRTINEFLLSKIESLSVSQPLDGRIFDFGDVTVVGSGGSQESFKAIKSPQKFSDMINQQISGLWELAWWGPYMGEEKRVK